MQLSSNDRAGYDWNKLQSTFSRTRKLSLDYTLSSLKHRYPLKGQLETVGFLYLSQFSYPTLRMSSWKTRIPLLTEAAKLLTSTLKHINAVTAAAASDSKFLVIITENMGPGNLRAQIKVLALQCYLLAHDPGQVNCISLGFHPIIYQLAFV